MSDNKSGPRPGTIVRCGDGSTWKLIKRMPGSDKGDAETWRADVINSAGDKNHEFAQYLEFDPGKIVVVSAKPRSS